MQYILTEQEMNRGCELIEMWTEENVPFGELDVITDGLHEQGYFTVVEYVEHNDRFRITVFQKND